MKLKSILVVGAIFLVPMFASADNCDQHDVGSPEFQKCLQGSIEVEAAVDSTLANAESLQNQVDSSSDKLQKHSMKRNKKGAKQFDRSIATTDKLSDQWNQKAQQGDKSNKKAMKVHKDSMDMVNDIKKQWGVDED